MAIYIAVNSDIAYRPILARVETTLERPGAPVSRGPSATAKLLVDCH